jgi:hypothetical protein
MVHNHLSANQCQPQRQGRAGQVVPAEVSWLVGIIGTAPGDADAGGWVAGAALRAPVDSPASDKWSVGKPNNHRMD